MKKNNHILESDKENRNPNFKRKLPLSQNLIAAMRIVDKKKTRVSNRPLRVIENGEIRRSSLDGVENKPVNKTPSTPSMFKANDLVFYRDYGESYFMSISQSTVRL